MKTIKENIKELKINHAFYKAIYGIEKEGLRVLNTSTLSLTEHSTQFGNRSFHPYIQTDFSESQLELITPPLNSISETNRWLSAIHDVVLRTISKDEFIWPMSMPVVLPEESIIPIANLDSEKDVAYRKHLADKYGKNKQMLSGVHYNFELDKEMIKQLYLNQTEYVDLVHFQSSLYLKLARNFLRYRWVLTYLLSAAPVADSSFFKNKKCEIDPPKKYIRSIRSSHFGYANSEDVSISFETVEKYVENLETAVNEGMLSEEKEFYSGVRLRGTKKAREMLQEGISYVELRIFDLNPFDAFGISEQDMQFIHLFCMLMIWKDESATMEEVEKGKEMSEIVALENPFEATQYHKEGMDLINQMFEMIQETNGSLTQTNCIQHAKEQFEKPETTIAARMVEGIENNGTYLSFGMQLAEKYKKESLEKPYMVRGFSNMELSTQLLIFDAIQKGLIVEILDETEQFLKLSYKDHVEYVKNANMTSKDQYIAPLIMENKTVTKKILAAKGFNVPAGEEYHNKKEAEENYWLYKTKGIVIKPKSTNYGIGISIFKEGADLDDYQSALDFAFKEDSTILVEEFIEGTEYRFFVLDGQVAAILLRTPANVIGDGEHTIKELVAEKNKNPLRGTNHRAPLEAIQLDEIEQLMLKEQGYTIDSIPKKDIQVYLRENSNMSTGGDSTDVTDIIDDSYKKAAIEMTEAVGARVCGVDLIIPDYTHISTKEAPGYTVIEANFNPAMHMHAYVSKGQGRPLTMGILKMLFPEII
ncbi:bifunctional glutamate--cysteine ligase GshA/glutathione synthetase GshB [Carnobacterium funditum]|uniref:bifunctional glutamate--cysteine ligase GshA/glutathione synthetase GshB n=1 Tax=Carnobacterium funditum TaxID=2752 RepID=UPI0005528327|nr:bifunctional glutamate--cysteine ligase GshA/glutathione synthetase GshB [Carnobacterium funditum]